MCNKAKRPESMKKEKVHKAWDIQKTKLVPEIYFYKTYGKLPQFSDTSTNENERREEDEFKSKLISGEEKSMGKVASLANNVKKFSNNSKYSQSEREAILAKISLYLMSNKSHPTGANNIQRSNLVPEIYFHKTYGKLPQFDAQSNIQNKSDENDKVVVKTKEEDEKRMAKVAALANNVKKFSTNSKYSQVEREAILAKISLYLMNTKTSDSKEFGTQTIQNNKSTNLHKSYGSLPELDMIDRDILEDQKYSNCIGKHSFVKQENSKKELPQTKVENKSKYSQTDKEAILAKISLYLMDLKNKYSSSTNSSAEVSKETDQDGLTLLRNAYDSLSEFGSDDDFEEFELNDDDTLSSYSEDEFTSSTQRNSLAEDVENSEKDEEIDD